MVKYHTGEDIEFYVTIKYVLFCFLFRWIFLPVQCCHIFNQLAHTLNAFCHVTKTQKLRKGATYHKSKYWEYWMLDLNDICAPLFFLNKNDKLSLFWSRIAIVQISNGKRLTTFELGSEKTYLLTAVKSFTRSVPWKKNTDKGNILAQCILKGKHPLVLYALKLGTFSQYRWFYDKSMHIRLCILQFYNINPKYDFCVVASYIHYRYLPTFKKIG